MHGNRGREERRGEERGEEREGEERGERKEEREGEERKEERGESRFISHSSARVPVGPPAQVAYLAYHISQATSPVNEGGLKPLEAANVGATDSPRTTLSPISSKNIEICCVEWEAL